MSKLPTLPGYVAPIAALRGGAGRKTAAQINKAATPPQQRTATVAASGALLPITYGRDNVPGLIFAKGLIGTDLVLGAIWSIGEIDAIEKVYINDVDASTISGVTITNYLGTSTQTADATLSSAIAGYNDTLTFAGKLRTRGIAYTVARITTAAAITGFPRFRATIRGLKILDPRSGTPTVRAYYDNTALCLADLIADPDFGLGVAALNVAAAANWNDTLLGGSLPRCRLSITLADGRPVAPDWLDLFAEYAECFYVYDGADIRLIPDQAVDLGTVPTVAASSIVSGSLSVQALDGSDSPTEVEVRYKSPTSGTIEALPWPIIPATPATTPGADRIPTSVSLEGVYRAEEASNKALARLNRLAHRVSVAWQTFDAGVVYQMGDVVNVSQAARGVSLPVRIMSVGVAGPGRYSVSAMRYDASHYPSELISPPGTAPIPDGAIVLYTSASVPSGYTAFTAANGKYIMGESGTKAIAATGGAAATGAWSGTTATGGAHTGSSSSSFQAGTSGSNAGIGVSATNSAASVGGHTHTWTADAATMNLYRRRHTLCKKVTAASTAPTSIMVFGLASISHPNVARVLTGAGRLLMADTAIADAGAATQSLSATVASANMSHTHYTRAGNQSQDFAPYTDIAQDSGESTWAHTHTASLTLTAAIKRRKLAMYGGTSDYPMVPGMIVLWDGGANPSGWVTCDGTAGTPDMRDFLLEIAASDQEGVSAGDNTVAASCTSGNYGHSHRQSDRTDGPNPITVYHGGTVYHNHTLSASQSFTPPWYALRFIMKTT